MCLTWTDDPEAVGESKLAYRPNKLMPKLIRSQIVLILGGAQHTVPFPST